MNACGVVKASAMLGRNAARSRTSGAPGREPGALSAPVGRRLLVGLLVAVWLDLHGMYRAGVAAKQRT